MGRPDALQSPIVTRNASHGKEKPASLSNFILRTKSGQTRLLTGNVLDFDCYPEALDVKRVAITVIDQSTTFISIHNKDIGIVNPRWGQVTDKETGEERIEVSLRNPDDIKMAGLAFAKDFKVLHGAGWAVIFDPIAQ
ncbi:hypothetical protein HY024_00205 [Candidatus Curtissbacteria bacterium]|nr:hypothetical protein [Candidatus Curtissbacteria bacterium]